MPRGVRYLDETVVGIVTGYATTTHLNRLGYKLTKKQVERGSRHALERPFVYAEHDTDDPPGGKVVKSEVRKLDNGEYGLWVEIEVYNEAALQTMKRNRGLSIGLRTGPLGELE